MVSVATTARIYILSVSQASNVDLWHGATHCIQTFCPHIGRYQMKVNASTSKLAFVKIVAILCHGHLHFQQLLLFVQL